MPRWSRGPARLPYRPGSRGPRLSLFHVKLTDAALQALLAHRRLQGAPRPVIAFRGSQGYLRIPRPRAGRPGPRSRLFSFFLSRCGREEPQASFDCVRQAACRLESEGVIRERLTFCADAEADGPPPSGQALRAALEPRATRWRGPGFPGAESSWWGRRVAPRERSRPRPGGPAGELGPEQALPEQLLPAGAGGPCCGGPRETPDYSLNYGPISSAHQCQVYKEAFSTDYAEYLPLHTRIASVSSRFAQLGAGIQALQRGTEHYKVLENQILQEYQQFKQVYPNYQQEKQHCEYLHKKLSHIKEQILIFEHNISATESGR